MSWTWSGVIGDDRAHGDLFGTRGEAERDAVAFLRHAAPVPGGPYMTSVQKARGRILMTRRLANVLSPADETMGECVVVPAAIGPLAGG